MAEFSYVRDHYGVPAEMGRLVIVYGKPGIIAADRGHYIGVNFDSDKPGVIRNAHPTSEVVYLGMGVIRKPTASQKRYQPQSTREDAEREVWTITFTDERDFLLSASPLIGAVYASGKDAVQRLNTSPWGPRFFGKVRAIAPKGDGS